MIVEYLGGPHDGRRIRPLREDELVVPSVRREHYGDRGIPIRGISVPIRIVDGRRVIVWREVEDLARARDEQLVDLRSLSDPDPLEELGA